MLPMKMTRLLIIAPEVLLKNTFDINYFYNMTMDAHSMAMHGKPITIAGQNETGKN
jgi:hypothetical protein